MSFTKEIWILIATMVTTMILTIVTSVPTITIGYKVAIGIVGVGLFGLAAVVVARLKQRLGEATLELQNHKKMINEFPQTKDIAQTHPIFGYFSQWLDFFRVKFKMDDPAKLALFKEILIRRFQTWHYLLFTIYKKGSDIYVPDPLDYSEASLATFKNEAIKSIDKLYKASSDFFVDNNTYSIEDRKTLSAAIDICDEWQIDSLKLLKKKVRQICDNNSMYQTYGMKNYEILTAVHSSLADIIRDSSVGLDHLNGRLNGLTFQGLTIKE